MKTAPPGRAGEAGQERQLAQPLDVAPSEVVDDLSPGHAQVAQLARSDLNGILLAAFGAIAFSGKAIIVKLAYHYPVDAITLLALRMLVAFPLFLAMAVWAYKRHPPLATGDRWRIAGLGFLGYYLASFLDFAGLEHITATLERLILYLNPTLVLLLGWLLFKRRISRRQLLAMVVCYAGVVLAVGHDLEVGGSNVAVGGALVFASALSYALYLIGSGEMVQRVGAVRLTAYASSVACVLCIGQFLLTRPWAELQLAPQVYGLSLINGTLCTVLPVLAVMMAVARIGSGLAAQVGMLGPVSTIVLSVFLLGEPMGPWQVAGTALVLVGVYLVTRK